MASIAIRRLDESVKVKLRVRAAEHGHLMEAEAREVLKAALLRDTAPRRNPADSIRGRFAPLGGVELPAIPRESRSRKPTPNG
jgi:plasmid stability protein